MKHYSKIKAFGLAEVLITLTLIGVIAALTIPVLLQSSNDAENKVAFKKAYAELSQATNKIMLENAGTMKKLCINPNATCFRNKYATYLNTTKTCDTGNVWENCWVGSGITRVYPDAYTNHPEWFANPTWYNWPAIVLSNGAFLEFQTQGSSGATCTGTFYGTLPKCAVIFIDVNGFKGPNLYGKDTFMMQITENALRPLGVPEDGRTCASDGTGFGCAAQVLLGD